MTLADITSLSDDELRVKVAELVGWGITENLGRSGGVLARQPNGQTLWDQAYLNKHQALVNESPNFPGSRDAMAEAEGTLHPAEIDDYVEHVGALVRNYWISQGKDVANFNQHSVIFAHMAATARQRAIAFIATKEGVR